MKYMLMMHAPRGSGDYAIGSWSQGDLEAHIRFMHDFNRKLTESGELAGAEGLAPPGEAKLVRAGRNGEPVTDGPFAEAKEFLAGYWMESAERAYEIAAAASLAPGPGGAPPSRWCTARQRGWPRWMCSRTMRGCAGTTGCWPCVRTCSSGRVGARSP